jgi:hypothetical protein
MEPAATRPGRSGRRPYFFAAPRSDYHRQLIGVEPPPAAGVPDRGQPLDTGALVTSDFEQPSNSPQQRSDPPGLGRVLQRRPTTT